jgi:hypothetical protein
LRASAASTVAQNSAAGGVAVARPSISVSRR